jgi:hypothetical protein
LKTNLSIYLRAYDPSFDETMLIGLLPMKVNQQDGSLFIRMGSNIDINIQNAKFSF